MAIRTIAPPADDSQRTSERESSKTRTPSPPQRSHERIAERAYRRFEARGRTDGLDLQDWLDAERELEELLTEEE